MTILTLLTHYGLNIPGTSLIFWIFWIGIAGVASTSAVLREIPLKIGKLTGYRIDEIAKELEMPGFLICWGQSCKGTIAAMNTLSFT